MPRISTSPIPAIKTLVTGMAAFFLSDLDHRARIHDRSLRRLGEKLDVLVDDVIEHDDAAPVPDASGIVRQRHAYCARRLPAARNIALLRNRPRPLRSLRLRHRRRRIRPGS